ncbi:MAG TPA: hypothetical protein VGK67_22000 [Myxococcales bacterium]|jgi:hypothetical protein
MRLRTRPGLALLLASCCALGACAGPAAAPAAKVVRLATDDWSSVTLAGAHRMAALWLEPGGRRLWAAGQGAVVRWERDTPPEITEVRGALTALWGSSPADVWAVGSDGARAHFDGTAWTVANEGGGEATSPLFAVWGTGPADVWAAGETILRWDGKAWTALPSPSALWIRGVWGSSPSDVWLAAGAAPFAEVSGGEVLHWDGKTLASALKTPEPVQAVWGSSAQDVWVVGSAQAREDAPARSVLRHFDGAAWSEAVSLGGIELLTVWGSGPREVWSAGLGGQVMRFDGTTWAPLAVGSRLDLAAGARGAATTYLLSPSGELLARDESARP